MSESNRAQLRDLLMAIEEEPDLDARVTVESDEATLALRGEYIPSAIEQRLARADWTDPLGTHAESVDGEPVVVRVVELSDDLHADLRGIDRRAPVG